MHDNLTDTFDSISVMMRNGCMALSQFRYTGDFHYDYERLVRVLFHAVSLESAWSRFGH